MLQIGICDDRQISLSPSYCVHTLMKGVEMKVYLDLEGTVLTNFDDPVLMNVQRVKDFLDSLNVKVVSVFSFAVYDERDKETFAREMQPMLERALGVTVMECPSVDDMMAEVFHQTGCQFGRQEFLTAYGKENAFRAFVKATQDSGTFLLLDDVVEDTCFNRNGKHTQQTVKTVNVLDV